MATIREALLSVEGEDATSIQPIVANLSELGFNVDVKAGGAFRLLDAHAVAGLNVRQQLALKAAIQAASAGLSVRSPAGAGGVAGGSAAATGAAARLGMWSPAAAGDVTSLFTPEVTARVSQLLYSGETIGTAVRIAFTHDRMGDVILTARHAIVEQGACLPNLSAFGSELKFVAAQPNLDVAVFRGPRGPGFLLHQWPVDQGMWLGMLSFPEAVDEAVEAAAAGPPGGAAGSAATTDETPMVDTGFVSTAGGTGQYAAASMNTGMPHSPGGAVVGNMNTLVGIYICTVQKPAGSSHDGSYTISSRSSSSPSNSSRSGSDMPPSTVEFNRKAMWMHPDEDAEVDDSVAAAAGDPVKTAELSRFNLGHKTSASIFVTVTALWGLLADAKVIARDGVNAAAQLVARRAMRVSGSKR